MSNEEIRLWLDALSFWRVTQFTVIVLTVAAYPYMTRLALLVAVAYVVARLS